MPCKYAFGAVVHIENILEEFPFVLKMLQRYDLLHKPLFVEELKEVQQKAKVRMEYSQQELRKLSLKQRVKLVKGIVL